MTAVPCPFAAGTPLVAYLRHSPGEDQTIASQESAVRAWFARHDLTLVRLFKDEALSGTTTAGRDDFLLMFDQLIANRVAPRPAGVVLWSFSRFARDVKDAEYYKWSLRHAKYEVFSMTDKIPEGDLAPVFESFIHWKDAERSKEIGRDAQRGLQDLIAQGYCIGGFPPIGYRKGAPIELGRKKNGEVRLAHKLEKDPDTEARVALAWRMKLQGANHWDIHQATRLMAGPRGYTDFFKNATYAGIGKCGKLRVPQAHPAYVTQEEFDRVQAMRLPSRGRVQKGNSENHPARRKPGSTYLLSGVIKCGYCGWSMVGNGTGTDALYRCDWRHRAGNTPCEQRSLSARYLHETVCQWLAAEVTTYERLAQLRDRFTAALSGSGESLREEQVRLREDLDRVSRQIGHLLTALERGGWTAEVQERLDARRREKVQLERDLDGLGQKLKLGQIKVSDEVLRYLATHFAEALATRSPEQARPIIRMVIPKAELYKEKLRLHYTPELLMQVIMLGAERTTTGLWSLPPPEFVPKPSYPLWVYELAIVRPNREHARRASPGDRRPSQSLAV